MPSAGPPTPPLEAAPNGVGAAPYGVGAPYGVEAALPPRPTPGVGADIAAPGVGAAKGVGAEKGVGAPYGVGAA